MGIDYFVIFSFPALEGGKIFELIEREERKWKQEAAKGDWQRPQFLGFLSELKKSVKEYRKTWAAYSKNLSGYVFAEDMEGFFSALYKEKCINASKKILIMWENLDEDDPAQFVELSFQKGKLAMRQGELPFHLPD